MTEQEKQEIIQALKEELSKELLVKKSSLASLRPYTELSNFSNELLKNAGFKGKKAYDIKNSINLAIKAIFDIDRMCHLKHSDLSQAKEITTKILNLIISNKSNNKE